MKKYDFTATVTLLEILADPAKAKATLEELRQATAERAAKAAELQELATANDQAGRELDAQRKQMATDQAALDSKTVALNERAAELDTREAHITAGRQQLDADVKQNQAFANELQAKADELLKQGQQQIAKQAALDDRETRLKAAEAAHSQKAAKLKELFG